MVNNSVLALGLQLLLHHRFKCSQRPCCRTLQLLLLNYSSNSPPARWGSLGSIRVVSPSPSSAGTARPQPRAPDLSGHCRTSTVSSRSQWTLPGLSQPRGISNRMTECQNRCQIECQNGCLKRCQIECQNRCKIECQNECLKRCQIECQNRCQIGWQNECQNLCQKVCQNRCQIIKCQIDCQIKLYARKNVR